MSSYRKSTIKDVAKHAGISTTTVSYVVSGRRNVCSPETAERIRAAVDLLHYTPSSLVSGMQKNVRFAIGACIRSAMDQELQFGSFFFHRIWHGLFEEADATNYSLLRYPISTRQSESCDDFLDGRVDGVLFHAHTYDNVRPARIAAAGMPIVLLTRSIDIPNGCATVYVDETEVIDLILDRLEALGHTRIAHVAGPVLPAEDGNAINVDDVAIQRLRAYEAWMTRRGLFDPVLVHSALAWDSVDLTLILQRWSELPERPTAIVCANDALALSAIAAAARLEWSVPESLSIVGIDNREDRADARIALSTVDVPIRKLARESIRCLLRVISGEKPGDNVLAVRGAAWVEGASVAPAVRPR